MLDVIIIGAGQAGLTATYYLKEYNVLVLEKEHKIGFSWFNRYDSLTLFTPRQFSSLPGLALEGDPQGFPTKDEIGLYLQQYVLKNNIKVELNMEVIHVTKNKNKFIVNTATGSFESKAIIIATGPFQTKKAPPFSQHLNSEILQYHSSEYVNATQLHAGTTIVVGAGNSGCQIAVELANADHIETPIYIAASTSINFKPLTIFKVSIFNYLNKLNILRKSKHSIIGKWLMNAPEHIYGFELKDLIKRKKVIVTDKVVSASENEIRCQDGTVITPKNIIWATGFKSEYNWLQIEGSKDETGLLRQNRGVSDIQGLYTIGLPWQTSRGSALIGWVKYDAEEIANHLISYLNRI